MSISLQENAAMPKKGQGPSGLQQADGAETDLRAEVDRIRREIEELNGVNAEVFNDELQIDDPAQIIETVVNNYYKRLKNQRLEQIFAFYLGCEESKVQIIQTLQAVMHERSEYWMKMYDPQKGSLQGWLGVCMWNRYKTILHDVFRELETTPHIDRTFHEIENVPTSIGREDTFASDDDVLKIKERISQYVNSLAMNECNHNALILSLVIKDGLPLESELPVDQLEAVKLAEPEGFYGGNGRPAVYEWIRGLLSRCKLSVPSMTNAYNTVIKDLCKILEDEGFLKDTTIRNKRGKDGNNK